MTETAVEPVAAEVDQWLARFEEALAAGDSAAAAELFGEDSFWRDLVAFTWNLRPSRARRASGTCSTRRSGTRGRATGGPANRPTRRTA